MTIRFEPPFPEQKQPMPGRTDAMTPRPDHGETSYVGSGRLKGKRAIFAGRAQVRCVLYMATLAARRCNPVIRALAQRLERAGKPFKLVMVACMHKLLTIANAMLKNNQPWDPKKCALNP